MVQFKSLSIYLTIVFSAVVFAESFRDLSLENRLQRDESASYRKPENNRNLRIFKDGRINGERVSTVSRYYDRQNRNNIRLERNPLSSERGNRISYSLTTRNVPLSEARNYERFESRIIDSRNRRSYSQARQEDSLRLTSYDNNRESNRGRRSIQFQRQLERINNDNSRTIRTSRRDLFNEQDRRLTRLSLNKRENQDPTNHRAFLVENRRLQKTDADLNRSSMRALERTRQVRLNNLQREQTRISNDRSNRAREIRADRIRTVNSDSSIDSRRVAAAASLPSSTRRYNKISENLVRKCQKESSNRNCGETSRRTMSNENSRRERRSTESDLRTNTFNRRDTERTDRSRLSRFSDVVSDRRVDTRSQRRFSDSSRQEEERIGARAMSTRSSTRRSSEGDLVRENRRVSRSNNDRQESLERRDARRLVLNNFETSRRRLMNEYRSNSENENSERRYRKTTFENMETPLLPDNMKQTKYTALFYAVEALLFALICAKILSKNSKTQNNSFSIFNKLPKLKVL